MSKNNMRRSGGARQLTADPEVLFTPYFQPKSIYFSDGTSYVYLDRMKFDTGYPSFEQNGTMMAALPALALIYSPRMKVEQTGEQAEIIYQGKTAILHSGDCAVWAGQESYPMELPVQNVNGILYVAVESLMTRVFGKAALWEGTYLAPRIFLGIGEQESDLFENMNVVKDMIIHLHKKVGVLKRAYYFKKAEKVCPYSLYVPMSYDASKPSRLAMVLHGAMQGAADLKWLSTGQGHFEEMAEKYHTILLFVDGYAEGFYGGGTKPTLNRSECGPDIRHYLDLCEAEPFAALEEVKKEFNIDTSHLYLFGNSMGGGGTFYLGNAYPHLFRAIAPCGALVSENLDAIDMGGIRDMPILLVVGTENIDFANLDRVVDYLKQKGAKAEGLGVGGGIHADAWIKALPDIFAFFVRT